MIALERMTLTADDARPKYQQIKDLVRRQIRSGAWGNGMRMPSENDWVVRLGVSRMTVNRALRELSQEGHIERVHGVGTFVATPVAHASLIELKDIADEIAARGHRHSAQVVRARTVPASRAVSTALDVDVGTQVFEVTVVHCDNDLPMQIEERTVNPALAPEFLQQDFTQQTPTAYLLGLVRPTEMEHRVQAVAPDSTTVRHLAIKLVEPCLRLTRRTWCGAQVVTCVSLTYPGSRYDLVARYTT